MSKIYVIQSVEGHYFSKQEEWVSGLDTSIIYFGKHKDVTLNQLIDITIKDTNVRAKIVESELDDKARPIIEVMVETDLIEKVETEAETDENDDQLATG